MNCEGVSLKLTSLFDRLGYAGLQGRDEQSDHHAEESANYHQLFLQLLYGNV